MQRIFSEDEENALYNAIVECGRADAAEHGEVPHEHSHYDFLNRTPITSLTVALVERLHLLGFEICKRSDGAGKRA